MGYFGGMAATTEVNYRYRQHFLGSTDPSLSASLVFIKH